MRHYGRSGNQCAPPPIATDTNLARYRDIGRSVAFGRVPPKVVRWLGVVAVALIICVGLFSMANLHDSRKQAKPSQATFNVRP